MDFMHGLQQWLNNNTDLRIYDHNPNPRRDCINDILTNPERTICGRDPLMVNYDSQMVETQFVRMRKCNISNITIPRGTRFCPFDRHNNVVDPVQNQESRYYLTLDEDLSFDIDADYLSLNVEINGTRVDVVGFDVNDPESVKKYETNGTCKMPIFAREGLRYHVNSVAKDPIGLIHSFENRQMIAIEPNSKITLHTGTKIVLKTPISEACVKDGKCPECENYKNNNLYSQILSDVKAKI